MFAERGILVAMRLAARRVHCRADESGSEAKRRCSTAVRHSLRKVQAEDRLLAGDEQRRGQQPSPARRRRERECEQSRRGDEKRTSPEPRESDATNAQEEGPSEIS